MQLNVHYNSEFFIETKLQRLMVFMNSDVIGAHCITEAP